MQEFRWIYENQWKLLHASGLHDAVDRISIGVVHYSDETRLLPEILNDPKCYIHTHPDRQEYEFFTLKVLQSCVSDAPDNLKVWYIHTKGATTSTNPAVDPVPNGCYHWKNYLEHFSIARWRDCDAALDNHDVCGVEWRTEPSPHFSGNFWAANAGYLKKLPSVADIQEKHRHDRIQAELWIGRANPKVKCFSNFHKDMYRQNITPEMYQSK